jgi:hypothetical protein
MRLRCRDGNYRAKLDVRQQAVTSDDVVPTAKLDATAARSMDKISALFDNTNVSGQRMET